MFFSKGECLKKNGIFKKYFLLEEIWSVSHVLEFKTNGTRPIISKRTYENFNEKSQSHLAKHSFLEHLSTKEIFPTNHLIHRDFN